MPIDFELCSDLRFFIRAIMRLKWGAMEIETFFSPNRGDITIVMPCFHPNAMVRVRTSVMS